MTVFNRVTGIPASPAGNTTALHFTADTTGDSVRYAFNVTSGHTYSFSAWLQRVLADAGCSVAMKLYNASGTLKATAAQGSGTSPGRATRSPSPPTPPAPGRCGSRPPSPPAPSRATCAIC